MKQGLLFSFLLFSLTSFSQVFTPLQSIVLPTGVYTSNVNAYWIDYDNDNDLDMLLKIGFKIHIYNNNGGAFSQTGDTINSFTNNIFGDIDNDGDVDILTYYSGGPYAFYRNTLPDSTGFQLIQDSCFIFNNLYGIISWSDLLNHGKLDIYGFNTSYTSMIYKNSILDSCGFTFYDSIYGSIYQFSGGVFFNDINNDGYIDIHYTGQGYTLLNNGINKTNKFTLVNPGVGLSYYGFYSNKLADFNNDGFLDNSISNSYLGFKIYKNNHNNTFTEQTNTGIPNTGTTQAIFDYNNDGKQDILINMAYPGQYHTIFKIRFYKNFGNFSFQMDNNINEIIGKFNEISPADFDNDHDLDMFINGELTTTSGYFSALYRNDSTPSNTPPTAPITMWTTMDSTKVIFHWRRATDVETPQITLSYNLMVGTSSKGIDITSPMADTVTGFRRVVELGNAQLNNFYILDKSIFNPGDTVYWSVQTIDNGFGYSPFSKENSAIISGRMEEPVWDTICSNDSVLWRGSYYKSAGRHRLAYGAAAAPDSVFFLDLQLNPAYLNEQTVNLCTGQSYQWQGQTYYNSGIYQIYNTTVKGCDSIERLVLYMHPDFTNLQSADLCQGDSLAFGGGFLHSSGVYDDSLLTVNGCDSVVKLTLSVFPKDTTVLRSGDSLIAQSNTATVRWWDCDAQSYVYGAGGKLFIPWQNGRYAAELTENGCTWLSRCFEFTGLGMKNTQSSGLSIKLMPNPNGGTFFLELIATGNRRCQIQIFNTLGKEILRQDVDFVNNTKLKFDLGGFGAGVYQLRVVSGDGVLCRKVVVE